MFGQGSRGGRIGRCLALAALIPMASGGIALAQPPAGKTAPAKAAPAKTAPAKASPAKPPAITAAQPAPKPAEPPLLSIPPAAPPVAVAAPPPPPPPIEIPR